MVRIVMDSQKEYLVEMDVSDFMDIIFDYNSLLEKEILKNDIVRISDKVLINPSHISSIIEVEMIFNMSRGIFQERKL